MKGFLIAALLANTIIGTSCPMYLPQVSDMSSGEVMSRDISSCPIRKSDQIAKQSAGPCAGGRCIETRPDEEDTAQTAPHLPLFAAAIPEVIALPDIESVTEVALVAVEHTPFETHTDTIVWRN
jgi:hypothetical protein